MNIENLKRNHQNCDADRCRYFRAVYWFLPPVRLTGMIANVRRTNGKEGVNMNYKIITEKDFKKFQIEWHGMEQVKLQEGFRGRCDELVAQAQNDNAKVTLGDINSKLLHPLLSFLKSPLYPERDFLNKGYSYTTSYDDDWERWFYDIEEIPEWQLKGDDESEEDFFFSSAMYNDIQTIKVAVVTFVIHYLLFRNYCFYADIIVKYLEDEKIMEDYLPDADDYQVFCYKQLLASCPSGRQFFEKYCHMGIPV